MKTVVLKAGGSGNIIESSFRHRFAWLNYRRMRINAEYFDALTNALLESSKHTKIVFVCGGLAAYLLLDLARELHLSRDFLQKVGCSHVELVSSIISQCLHQKSGSVAPGLVRIEEMEEQLAQYNIVVAQPCPRYASTDTLAAKAAAVLPQSQLLFFKRGVHTYFELLKKDFSDVISSSDVSAKAASIESLLAVSSKFQSTPGQNFFLETSALRIILAGKIKTRFLDAEDIIHLSDVVRDPENAQCVTVTFPRGNES